MYLIYLSTYLRILTYSYMSEMLDSRLAHLHKYSSIITYNFAHMTSIRARFNVSHNSSIMSCMKYYSLCKCVYGVYAGIMEWPNMQIRFETERGRVGGKRVKIRIRTSITAYTQRKEEKSFDDWNVYTYTTYNDDEMGKEKRGVLFYVLAYIRICMCICTHATPPYCRRVYFSLIFITPKRAARKYVDKWKILF